MEHHMIIILRMTQGVRHHHARSNGGPARVQWGPSPGPMSVDKARTERGAAGTSHRPASVTVSLLSPLRGGESNFCGRFQSP